MTLVSVLTPTIDGRERLLEECKLSIVAQTTDAWEHIIERDPERTGCSATMNRAAARARGDWIIPLADDDLLLPRCIETLVAHSTGADIVYAPPLVTGNEDRFWFFQAPPVLPSFALIRASLWRELGGYDESLRREEDRDLWIKAMNAGAVFRRADEPCWIYRQHSGNKSFQKAAA